MRIKHTATDLGDRTGVAALSATLFLNEVAEKLGLSHIAVRKWSRIPNKHLEAVHEMSDIPLHILRPDRFDINGPIEKTKS
jgi:hypothetical protein